AFDTVADPESPPTTAHPVSDDVDAFANFMRSTKAPPRDAVIAASPDAQNGQRVFVAIGCATCHTPDLQTAPAGASLGAGYVVPPALGGKVIHPYSDFLLHDVGTGDGIVQNGGPASRNMLRTPPLWGLRTKDRLMHDLLTVTRTEAILRHNNQARSAAQRFQQLSDSDRAALLTFLSSL